MSSFLQPVEVIIAVIICRLLWFSCKLIAFHADMCLLSMQACQMTADGWPSYYRGRQLVFSHLH